MGDPDLDPDHGRIITLIPNYACQIARHWRSIDATAMMSSALYLCTNAAVVVVGTQRGFGGMLLWYWIVPALLGALLCALVFDYLPHHPHTVTRSESLYGCTSVVAGIFSAGSGSSTRLL